MQSKQGNIGPQLVWAKSIKKHLTRAELTVLLSWWKNNGAIIHGDELAQAKVTALETVLKTKGR